MRELSETAPAKSKRGGRRVGAGRKPGPAARNTRRIVGEAFDQGISPLEVMIGAMRALWAQAHAGDVIDIEKATQASAIAKDAAPYMHPRLQNIEANVNVSNHESALAELEENDAA